MSACHPERAVLLVGSFLSAYGGSRCVCEDLAVRLSAAGWSVVAASARPGRLARLVDMVVTAWRKRHQYAVAQVDVFSGPAFLWAEAVCGTLRQARKPYVLTLHGGRLPDFARHWAGRVRRLLQSAAAVTVPSHYLLEQMRPYRSDLRLLPNPLDLSAYDFRLRDKPQPRLVWLRAFHKIYNPSLAPKVLRQLAGDFPDVQLTMVGCDKGDGSLQHMQRVAAELGVADRIALPGGVPKAEVPIWMNKGDIFLNTAHVDNAPVSVLEAMACGLCVVSTNVGGLPYLVGDGREGLLVPPDDPDAMAAAVRGVLTDSDLSQRLSRNARVKVEGLDWSVVMPQWEALLMGVAAGWKPCAPR